MAQNKKFRVSFYADKIPEINKLFSWKVNGQTDAIACVRRFERLGYKIRSAYFTTYRDGLQEDNVRIL